MKTRASLIAMSHLSDVQEVLSMNTTDVQTMNRDINFVKWLILELKGNLSKEIDADKMWKKFVVNKNNVL
jgi:hypothetical protein